MPASSLDPLSEPLPAASLLLLRDRGGLQVLMGRRGPHLRAFPHATVFPGGKIDAQDAAWPGADDDALEAAAHAALRETFEETALFLAADGEGPPHGADLAQARDAVESGVLTFAELAKDWARPVGRDRLTPFQRSVTPEGAPYRFDTWFFVAQASALEADAPLIASEISDLAWLRPAEVLADATRVLVPPTRAGLERLAPFATAGDAMRDAHSRMAR